VVVTPLPLPLWGWCCLRCPRRPCCCCGGGGGGGGGVPAAAAAVVVVAVVVTPLPLPPSPALLWW
jgi:hypothetical protein